MARLTTCRDCGTPVSTKAATCPKCGRPLSKPAKKYGCFSGCLTVGLVGIVAVLGYSLFNGGRNRPPANPGPEPPSSSSTPSRREDWQRLDAGYISDQELTYQGTPVVCLCVDDKAWNDLLDAENKGDIQEIALMVAKGKVALVPRGTRVKCVETGVLSLKLRVSEGLSAGVEGWLQREFVSKGEPPAELSPGGTPEHEDNSPPPVKKRKPTLQSKPLTTEDIAKARFQVGTNLEKEGREELAVTAYRELVKNFPDTPQAKQATERIKALTRK